MRRKTQIPREVLLQSADIRKTVLAEIKRMLKRREELPEYLRGLPEYAKAKTGRERYLKGWRTSFANSGESVNVSLLDQYGVKVKRQDGSAIEQPQIGEIAAGTDTLLRIAAFAPLPEALRTAGAIICHTSGKHPFMSDAAGTYHPSERSISVGLEIDGRPFRSLAHELTHLLDYEAGKAAGVETDITPSRDVIGFGYREDKNKRTTFALSEHPHVREFIRIHERRREIPLPLLQAAHDSMRAAGVESSSTAPLLEILSMPFGNPPATSMKKLYWPLRTCGSSFAYRFCTTFRLAKPGFAEIPIALPLIT